MSEWILAHDKDTGWVRPIRPGELPHGNYEEVEGDVLDANYDPVAPYRFEEGPEVEGYEAATVAALKAEIERRNHDRDEDDQISTQGNKPDLIAALEADDNKE